MARRRVNPSESLYSGARWQPYYRDVYTRTTDTWQTRVGRRNRESASFANLLGLNTSFDDLHKTEGQSPFLRNVRYMGDKQEAQRAQVTSRNGAKLLGIQNTATIDGYPGQYFIEIWEGRAIEFDIEPTDHLIIGGTLTLRNREGAKGRLRVFLKQSPSERAVCDANITLEGVSQTEYVDRSFTFITPLSAKNGLTIRLEIEGDVEPDACGDVGRGRKVWLEASGYKGHRSADYSQPNVNECMREIAYDWQEEPSIPCMSLTYSEGTPIPSATMACTDEGKFLIFPLKFGNEIQLWRFNVDTHEYQQIDTTAAPVSPEATTVRFAQGLGKMYFVDGHSPLQRIDMQTWKSELAIAKQEDIDVEDVTPEDMQARPGASLILRIKSRFFLAGFAKDPNFVQYSILNSLTGTADAPTENGGVQYDQYSDISYFYSPDKKPEDSVCAPITALAEYEGNLLIFRRDGASLWQLGNEFSAPSQADYFAYNLGVESQDDVCNLNGNIFIYNRSEGLRRFSGADATYQSMDIDNELRKLPQDSPRLLFGHANKIRLYCDLDNRGVADHNFLFLMALAGSAPWYCDDQTPITWVVGDQTSDTVYAMHSSYPAIYIVDADDQYTDFDSSIVMQYHTQYRSPGDISGWTILRRVLVKLIASSTNVWYVGVDFDHKDNPAVWRRYVRQQQDEERPVEGVFENTADAGAQTISLPMRAKIRDFQVRVSVSSWRDNAMLLYIEGQYGGQNAL